MSPLLPRDAHSCHAGPRRTAPHGPQPQEENMMDYRPHRLLGIIALVGLLGVSPSWGAPPNNDVSDALGNTAGGTNALSSTTTGSANTAFGFQALVSNTTGNNNTATGLSALQSNTT